MLGLNTARVLHPGSHECRGLKAVMPATPNDVYDSMRAAVRDDNPVLLLLSKKLISTVGDLR